MIALSLSGYSMFNEMDLMHQTLQNNCTKMVPNNGQNWKLIMSTNHYVDMVLRQTGIQKLK